MLNALTPGRAPLTTVRVVIVDDDAAALEALQRMLQLRFPRMEVETFQSAFDALERVSRLDFDAVLADVGMPGMDGLKLLACIRKRRPRLPTLLMTGHGDRELAERALREGAFAYIEKPLDRDYLMSALSSAIEHGQAARAPEQGVRGGDRDELQ
jgi:two-component system response regulator FixJ